MEVETPAERIGAEEMSGLCAVLLLGGTFGAACLSMWLLQGWVERRFGLSAGFARLAATLPGFLLGWLVIWATIRRRPSVSPEKRRRLAEKAEAGRRRHRPWFILFLVVLLLQQFAMLSAIPSGVLPTTDDWSSAILVFSVLASRMAAILPSPAGTPPGLVEFDQAERCEALRVGYLMLVVLGMATAAAAVRWPSVAAQAWPCVLLTSVLAAEVRMATLPRRVADTGPERLTRPGD